MTFFYRRFHRHGSHFTEANFDRPRAKMPAVPVLRSLLSFVILGAFMLQATLAYGQTRMEATTRTTLEVPASVSETLATQWRDALDAYRQELRQGQTLATRPLTQQSAEIEILTDHLRSAGYYNFDIQPRPTENYDNLRYRVNPGRRFSVRQITWDWPDDLDAPLEAQAALPSGQPLIAQDILTVRSQLRREIQNTECYLRVNVGYELQLDRSAHAGDLRFFMEPSPQVTIGEITVTGTDSVRPSYAVRLTQLQPGDCFQRPQLDQARLNLYESNLFARVDEQLSTPDENNQVNVRYRVQERFHRTLSLGGGYDTDAGLGANAEWTHRNFSGRGERVVLGT
ncbi:MAG: POTRA domain-containing protein [Natronospirillum sp.]